MRRIMLVLSITVVVVALSYGTALLAVVYAYRKGYGIAESPNPRSGSRQRAWLASRRITI